MNDTGVGRHAICEFWGATNLDSVEVAERALRRPTVLPTPLLPLKLRFGGELVETLLLVSQRVAPTKLEAVGFEFTCRSLDDAFATIL